MDTSKFITKIDTNLINLILNTCQTDAIIYNCCVNIIQKDKLRHKYLNTHILHIINSKLSAELMFICIVMNDIAFAKILIDNNFKYVNVYLPRNVVYKNHLALYVALDNRTFIFKMFMNKGMNLLLKKNKYTILESLIARSPFNILDICLQYNIKSDNCLCCVYTEYYNDSIHTISDELLLRFTYALKFQNTILKNDENIICWIIKMINNNNNKNIIEQFTSVTKLINSNLIPGIGFSIIVLANPNTFAFYINDYNKHDISVIIRSLLRTESGSHIKYIFDYYINSNIDIAKLVFYMIIEFDIYDKSSDIVLYIVSELIKYVEPETLLYYSMDKMSNNSNDNDENNIYINMIESIIEKYDIDIINKLIHIMPVIKDNLHKHIYTIIRCNKCDILKLISVKNYIQETALLYINNHEPVRLNKYVLYAIDNNAFNIYKYLLQYVEPNNLYNKYAIQCNFDSKKQYINNQILLEYKLHILYPNYENDRFKILSTLKYMILFILNICESNKFNIYKQIKYFEEITHSFENHMTAAIWLYESFGSVLPYSKKIITIFPLVYYMCEYSKGISNSNTDIDVSICECAIKNLSCKIRNIIIPFKKKYTEILSIIRICLNSKLNIRLKQNIHTHTLFEPELEQKVTQEIVVLDNIFELVKRLKYPTELPNYSKLYNALQLNTLVDCHKDRLVCTNNNITIIIKSTGYKYMKKIRHYACNIYSDDKTDINHIYDFSVDKYIHTICCKIAYDEDRSFENKTTTKAYFSGQMIIDNEIINGTYEYFTNCFGVTFHRLFRRE
jgi:hypothetical protein